MRPRQQPELFIRELPVDDLVPYANNAKEHPDSQVEQIAASISEFGNCDPVAVWHNADGDAEIVEGHGRVLALQKLGIETAPVIYLDHLTDEQRRAYTHVHNKLTMSSGFDFGILEQDLSGLDFDWEGFGFDGLQLDGSALAAGGTDPEEGFPLYGDERSRTDRAYNLDIVSATDCGEDGMPPIEAADHAPARLIGFNYAKTSDDGSAGIHFFIDDYQFERCWNEPGRYLDVLRGYDCVLTPDFSLYLDMPLPMQQWNVYRSRALGHWWQREGLAVIPTLSWSTPDSYAFAFAGLEPGGTYAVSTVGVKGDADALRIWHEGMAAAMDRLHPSRILRYGGDVGFDFGGCEAIDYANEVTERWKHGR